MDKHLDYEYLNSCRILSGLSNKAISTATNISEPSISRFFHGEMKDPSALSLCSICDTIGASIDRAYGVIKPIDTAMTEPAPSIPAVVTDVVQALPPLVDEQQVAARVAEAIKDSPAVDPEAIAKAVVAALPPHDCNACKSASTYEATIALQVKIMIALGSSLGLMILFLMILLLWK